MSASTILNLRNQGHGLESSRERIALREAYLAPSLAARRHSAAQNLSQPDLMQKQRYERKYLISPMRASSVCDEILLHGFLDFDKFTAKSPGLQGYLVHSLYLDSASKITYWQTVQGDPERLKLRIRFYEDGPEAPCFFEIKRRKEGQRIVKSRAQVLKSEAEAFLRNPIAHPITLEFLPEHLRNDPSHIAGLYAFRDLCDKLRAVPAAYTSYRRAGFESRSDNSERVTLDSDLRSSVYDPAKGLTAADRKHWPKVPFKEDVPLNTVCLELKHTGEHPRWMSLLVQRHDLRLDSCQKYVRSQNTLDPYRCFL